MSQQNPIEQYLQSLRAMGMNEEAIAMYRQQMEQSINITNQWASQFGQNIDPMNAMNQAFGSLGAFGNDDEQPKLSLNPESTLNTRQQWAIACGADLAMLNGQFLNDVTTGSSKTECRQLLSQWWDIDSKEELLEMIEWLFTEGHRIQYDLIWQAMNSISMKETKEFLREHVATNEEEAELALHRLRNMRDALELFQEQKLIAPDFQPEMLIWDFARVINLSRGGVDAGYITKEEALEIIDRCIDPVRKMYSSWKQLSVSYQFARYVWSDLEEEDCKEMMENMEILLTDPESPWVKMKWDEAI
jgi:tetratricopeptide (TPR) repeat protein